MSGNRVLELPCIGKPFQLGMLYDCRHDSLIPDAKLWNGDILSNALASRHSPQSQHEIFTNDSLNEKMEIVEARAIFKLSLLTGAANAPRNYASFFEDRVSTKPQARVTLKYQSISTLEELDVNLLESIPHEEFVEQENATHFVSGITYGSNNFFVFEREVRRNESHADVINYMQLLISSLPKVSNNETGLPEIAEMDKEDAKKMTCTIYGDSPLSGSTMSFEEGVKFFGELRKNRGTVVPIKVRLQPLSSLDVAAANFSIKEINSETITRVVSVVESFSDVIIRLDVLSKTKAFSNFSSIQKKIERFKAMISQFKNTLQKDLSRLLPRLISGDAEEEELVTMLKDVDTTPFTQACVSSWVDKAEKEVKLLSLYLDYFKGIQFAFNPEQLDTVINSIDYDKVVCFSFMIHNFQDTQLEEMHTFLRTDTWNQKRPEERNWYENQAVINDFKTKARRFSTFAKASVNDSNTKFVVTNTPCESKDDKIAVIQMFEGGQSTELNPDEIPSQPLSASARSVDDVSLPFNSMPKPNTKTLSDSEMTSLGETDDNFYFSGDQGISEPEAMTEVQDRSSFVEQKWESRERSSVNINRRFNNDEQKVEIKGSFSERPHRAVPKSSRRCGEEKRSHSFTKPRNDKDVNVLRNASNEKGKETWTAKSKLVDERRFVVGGRNLQTTKTGLRRIQAKHESGFCRLAERMRLQSEEIKSGNSRDSVSIYKIPTVETMRNEEKKLVKKRLRDPQEGGNGAIEGNSQEKVLMVMGATGAGKSTLINGMVNYVMGVDWEDNFRFKLIDETGSSQATSVTKEITAYTIHPMEGSILPYTFTIIDTPGFGDTEGLARDAFITGQIKEFFSLEPPVGIDHLDGIGFVTQSSLARLTPTQTYIFDAILSLFGKDMGNNIFMMVTFADGQHPPVLTAIKKAQISYQTFFKFNNSALFAANTNSGFDQMFWEMGKASFEEFFCQFQSSKSVKLEQTNQVLSERELLEVLVEGLNPQIKEGLAKLDGMRHERLALHQHESEMEHNKHFEFTVPTIKTTEIDLRGTGKHTTTCQGCNFSCHKDCKIADDSKKNRCVAMDEDGNCKVCSGKCWWERHRNVPYLIEYKTVYETRTSEDLKKKYNMAASGKIRVEGMLNELERQYYDLRLKVVTQMYEVRMCLHRLDEIALKPNPLTELDYIELLIDTEKREGQAGFLDRVKALEEVKSKATMFAKIKSTGEIPQLLEEILPKEHKSCTSGPGQRPSKTGLNCVIQ